jgi:hypothetical protein
VTQASRILHRALTLLLWPIVAGYLLLSEVVWPAARPIVRAFARLKLAQRLRQWLETLGPYSALVILAVPASVIELLKLLALYWISTGHVITGTAALLALHVGSLLSTERLFAVLKPQLLTIRWFAAVWRPVEAVRDRLIRWVRATRAWEVLTALSRRTRAIAGRITGWVRAAYHRRFGRSG